MNVNYNLCLKWRRKLLTTISTETFADEILSSHEKMQTEIIKLKYTFKDCFGK